jgi:hypothetical protein
MGGFQAKIKHDRSPGECNLRSVCYIGLKRGVPETMIVLLLFCFGAWLLLRRFQELWVLLPNLFHE